MKVRRQFQLISIISQFQIPLKKFIFSFVKLNTTSYFYTCHPYCCPHYCPTSLLPYCPRVPNIDNHTQTQHKGNENKNTREKEIKIIAAVLCTGDEYKYSPSRPPIPPPNILGSWSALYPHTHMIPTPDLLATTYPTNATSLPPIEVS